MKIPAFRLALLSGLAMALGAPALCHEDDPKILDSKPPVPGTGFRAAAPSVHLAPGQTAAAGLGFAANGITLKSWLTMEDLGEAGQRANDCWGYTSASGREYAIFGTSSATVFVEVTDPANPVVIDELDGANSIWRDIKTYQDFAYICSEGGGGVQVVYLGNLDNGNIALATTLANNPNSVTHNVAIDETSGFLYRCGGGNNGLRVYSLADPGAPAFAGRWSDRYVHDAQIVTYTSGPYAGRQIAYCCAGLNGGFDDTGLSVVDMTDKQNPVVLATASYPSRAYSHQGWLSEDRRYFYLGDELDEDNTLSVTTTHVFDVLDPANPVYVGAFDNGDAAVGHNMYTRNGLLFQANYTSGLRIFDVSDNPTNPQEVAFLDTAPDSSLPSFNGLWSCYPYFPSGTVIGSDIERGLFVMSVDQIDLNIALAAPAPEFVSPIGGTSVPVTITEIAPGSLDASTPSLVYDIGAGPVTIPLVANGGTSYTATFPSLPCGSSLTWYVTATSNTGLVVTAPSVPAPSLIADALITARDDDMESAAGWTAGAPGDDATTGVWTRGNPLGTAAQPEDDASEDGDSCWFTGQGSAGGSVGENDVDGGATTLLTPVLDMSALTDPMISYQRWYSNTQGGAAGADVFEIDVSANGGATWTSVEVVGPTGEGTDGGWTVHSFRLLDFVPATAQVQMRFVASDLGNGSIVEAGIDEFNVMDLNCGDGIGFPYCLGNPNSTGEVASILGLGSNSLAANDLSLVAIDLPLGTNGYFVVSREQAFVPNPGGSDGNLCIGAGTGRYLSQLGNSGAIGQLTLTVDSMNMPEPTGNAAAMAGETWNFQCWYRDANPIVTSNFTRGYAVTFQ